MKKLLSAGLLFLAGAAGARELYWSNFSVRARLGEDGALVVAETQEIVFSGDWNGGYRTFRVGPGQKLELHGISRIDSTGTAIPLVEGDVSQVDHFEWSGDKTVRWRSRRLSDPPFSGTAITYRLDYTLSGILKRAGTTYVLDHDFAFPEREAKIEHFTLDLEHDPAWQVTSGFAAHLERTGLGPGHGVILDEELLYRGANPPAASVTISRNTRQKIVWGIVALAILLLLRFRWWESREGRYRPLFPVTAITPAWLKENLFSWKAEEAGAAWDDDIGSAEVAATLARLVAEKKMESRVDAGTSAFAAGKPVLHLTLKVPRSHFSGYERELVDKMFFAGDETDTEAIRERYRGTGFDPSKILRDPLKATTEAAAGTPRANPLWEKAPAWALTLAGLALAATDLPERSSRGVAVAALFGTLMAAVLGMIVGAGLGSLWKRRYGPALDKILPFLLVPLPIFAAPAWFLAVAHYDHPASISIDPSQRLVLAAACLALALWQSYFLILRTKDSSDLLDRRRALASARRFFEVELAKPSPALEDSWYPYLIAFGLDHDLDRWFRAYGSPATGAAAFTHGGSGGGSSSGWTGGGGSFGGAGASAGWATAAAGMAAGVAAPSSSSGGGGGSSGGGGGGGW